MNDERAAPGGSTPDLPEGLFKALFDAAPDGMVLVDEEGNIVAVNRQAEELFDYERGELLGQSVDMLVPLSQRTAHARLRQGFTMDPQWRPMSADKEFRGRTKAGVQMPVEIMLAPIQVGDRLLVCAGIRDMSSRKEQEKQTRRLDLLLRGAVESFHGALAVFDEDDRLMLCNSTYRTFFGNALDHTIHGASYEALVDATLATGDFDTSERPRAALRQQWLAYHQAPKDGMTLLTASGRHLRVVERRTEDGGAITTATDITADVLREAELKAAQSTAEQANSAKSEFLSAMSHELRTPLNAILGFAQLLQRDKKDPLSHRQGERLEHVVKGGEHLLRLIDDLLDLSRIESGRLAISIEPVQVAEVIDEVFTSLGPVAQRARIALASPPRLNPPAWVLADRMRLSQILLNFGANSVKYGREGGSINATVGQHDGRVRVSVVDDGIGIAERHHGEIFEPFSRAGQEAGPIEGTGIGLALCKRLAEMMDGVIGFASAENDGSVFWVELPSHVPIVDERKAEPPDPEPMRTADPGRSATVIYVEDNPSNVALMEDFFGDQPQIRLVVAPNAELGLELIRSYKPQLVIMDLHLPGMSGFAATEVLKSDPATRHIPVVALSAAAMPQDRKRAEASGFHRYLTKPMRVDKLTEILRELLPHVTIC